MRGEGVQYGGTAADADFDKTCGICRGELAQPSVLTQCGHVYCREWYACGTPSGCEGGVQSHSCCSALLRVDSRGVAA